VFSWKNSTRLIPSTVYTPLPSIQMYNHVHWVISKLVLVSVFTVQNVH
jgi:hypothetical protein